MCTTCWARRWRVLLPVLLAAATVAGLAAQASSIEGPASACGGVEFSDGTCRTDADPIFTAWPFPCSGVYYPGVPSYCQVTATYRVSKPAVVEAYAACLDGAVSASACVLPQPFPDCDPGFESYVSTTENSCTIKVPTGLVPPDRHASCSAVANTAFSPSGFPLDVCWGSCAMCLKYEGG